MEIPDGQTLLGGAPSNAILLARDPFSGRWAEVLGRGQPPINLVHDGQQILVSGRITKFRKCRQRPVGALELPVTVVLVSVPDGAVLPASTE